MKTYKVIGYSRIEFKTIVKANSEAEAEKIAQEREIDICIHGTEDNESMECFTYEDAPDSVEINCTNEL